MILVIFSRRLPSTYYSLKITYIFIMILYIIALDVIFIYPKPILCRKDEGGTS